MLTDCSHRARARWIDLGNPQHPRYPQTAQVLSSFGPALGSPDESLYEDIGVPSPILWECIGRLLSPFCPVRAAQIAGGMLVRPVGLRSSQQVTLLG